jgi:hypothetical protein
MNRFIIGAIMAGLVLLALSGIGGVNRFFSDNDRLRSDLRAEGDSSLGTLPIDQAGRIVRRQTQAANGIPATGTATFGQTGLPADGSGPSSFTTPGVTGQPIPSATISPTATTVAPRTGTNNQFSSTGDVSPVQPDLVRPETLPPASDQNLESIPALW